MEAITERGRSAKEPGHWLTKMDLLNIAVPSMFSM